MSDKIKPENLRPPRRKTLDRSIILLIVGAVLLMPPIIGISLVDSKFSGIPIPVLYVFLIWAVLIVSAAILSRPLRDNDRDVQPSNPENNL